MTTIFERLENEENKICDIQITIFDVKLILFVEIKFKMCQCHPLKQNFNMGEFPTKMIKGALWQDFYHWDLKIAIIFCLDSFQLSSAVNLLAFSICCYAFIVFMHPGTIQFR